MSELAVGDSSKLPASWDVAAVDEVASINPKLVGAIDDSDQVHFVPMAAVAEDFGGIDVSATRPYGEVRKGYTCFASQDVLFAKITPCMENGKGALVPKLAHIHAFGSTEFHVLRSYGAVRPKWLARYLSQPDFRKAARHNMTGTAGQLRVPTKWLSASKLPVPPLAEQDRIVEKLEELLSDLDAGVAELKAAQRKLAQYRQSLLKAAVEGALTADWRAARTAVPSSSSLRKQGSSDSKRNTAKSLDSRVRGNDGHEETGAALLQRILTERRAHWEAKQLAKFAEQGKTPPKDWQSKYPEPVAPDTTDLPALPEGWAWASIEQVSADDAYSLAIGPFGSNLTVADYRSEGVPLVFVRHIRSRQYANTKFVSLEKADELKAHHVEAGDVLVTKMGEPPGDADIYPAGCQTAVITADCIKVRCQQGLMLPQFLAAIVNSALGKKQIQPITQGVAQKKVSLGRFSSLALPLPPIDEQSYAVAQLTVALKEADAQANTLEYGLKQAAAQRKNILKAAFAGQLVPQDPHDEPASTLLERIRTERVAAGANGAGETGQKNKRKAKEAGHA